MYGCRMCDCLSLCVCVCMCVMHACVCMCMCVCVLAALLGGHRNLYQHLNLLTNSIKINIDQLQ